MLNIRDLEKRWLRYKIRSYIPYIIIGFSIIVIAIIMYIFTATTISSQKETLPKVKQHIQKHISQKVKVIKKEKKHFEKTNQKVQQQNKEEINTIQQIKEHPQFGQHQQEDQLLLKPSMSFLTNIQQEKEQIKDSYQVPKTKTKKRKIQKIAPVEEEYFNQEQSAEKEKVKKEVPVMKTVITIERKDSQNDINEIIKRFKKNNNPALSLFVAKKYYELGNYEQAYNYALITNGIDNNIEDSWIVFAKSLVKLHKKEMAIKTLQEYISYSHSGNAKILLDDIKTGKFQ
jgi:tetratricopeptide (TPR) repeat protein